MHQDDQHDLFMFRKELAGWRSIQRLTFKQMAKKVFTSEHLLGNCERGKLGSMTFGNMQLWCKSLGMQFNWKFDLLPMPQTTPEMEFLDKMVASGEGNVDVHDRMLFIEIIKQMRWQNKVHADEVGKAIGIKGKSLVDWEGTATDVEVERAYGYVRACGGRLRLNASRL